MPSYKWKDRPLKYWIKYFIPSETEAYYEWRKENTPAFLFQKVTTLPEDKPWETVEVIREADQYLAGIVRYFSQTDYQIGFPPEWLLDPSQNILIPAEKHWSQISDDGAGDIKYIWEASRLSQLYTLVRGFARNKDENYPEAFWQVIEDWMQNNPPEMGPNWMDGQEAALRIMAICFGFYAFKDLTQTSPERVSKITILVAALADHIHKNIDYAIFTRSNHTISEGFGIWLAGTLFSELKNAQKYQRIGKQILEKEASKQIYQDGSYAMHSLNYHRYILHVYLFALRMAELNDQKFSAQVYQAIEHSIDYLYELIDPQSGLMPVYGSNDGAMVLPLNSCDYQDYRPVIQLGYYLIHGKRIFPPGAWDEDLYWFYGSEALESFVEEKPQVLDQIFPDSGLTRIQGEDTCAFVRCGEIIDRPTHADQNHVDLWWHGKNIALDAGTFLYSGKPPWRNGLAGTAVHNTVTVDDKDQMDRFSRFIWVNWSQGKILTFENNPGVKYWQGQHNGYSRLKDPVQHKRSVILLANQTWLVIDHLSGLANHEFTLNWLLCNEFSMLKNQENKLQMQIKPGIYSAQFGLLDRKVPINTLSSDPVGTRGWVSHYYGIKEPAISTQLTVNQNQAHFWSIFSPENYELDHTQNSLQIRSESYTVHFLHDKLMVRYSNQPEVYINPRVE